MIAQKILVQKGICSRREAERLLKAGLVLVNGQRARPGEKLTEKDVVTLHPSAQSQMAQKITVAVYKPRGVTCTNANTEGKNVFDVFPEYKNLNCVGRLDKESEGLLLLSNDGLITKKVTGNTHETEKEYEVITEQKVFPGKLKPMEEGMRLSDGMTLPAKIQIIDNQTFHITIHEGRNHQIRRMCGQLNLTILSLKRVRVDNIFVGKMRPGDSRVLTGQVLEKFRNGEK